MAQYTYNKLISANKAPRDARYIGVYDSQGTRVGEIPLGDLSSNRGAPL